MSRWASGSSSKQDVRLLLEAGGERDELSLATREAGGRKGQLIRREPELEQGGASPAGGTRATGSLEALERLLLAGEYPRHPVEVGDHLGAAELRREPGQLPVELDEIGASVEHGLERRSLVAGGVLVEICDAGATAARDLPAVGSLEPGQDLQQRRLAAAVRPDDADPRLGLDRQVGSVEDEARAERFGDRASGEERHGREDACVRASRGGLPIRLTQTVELPGHAENVPPRLKGAGPGPIDTG